VAEAAELLGVSPVTVRESIKRGDIPALRCGDYRINKAALAEKAGVGVAKAELAESVTKALLPRIGSEVARVMGEAFGRVSGMSGRGQ
jgi:excisionase family DNA binding protein